MNVGIAEQQTVVFPVRYSVDTVTHQFQNWIFLILGPKQIKTRLKLY